MKIKIGNKIYDGNNEPVMIILSNEDKENIAQMHLDAKKYCSYPETKYSEEEIKHFMKEEHV